MAMNENVPGDTMMADRRARPSRIRLHPLHEAAMRIADIGLNRSKAKTRDLVGMLLTHGARAWRSTQPRAGIHLHVAAPGRSRPPPNSPALGSNLEYCMRLSARSPAFQRFKLDHAGRSWTAPHPPAGTFSPQAGRRELAAPHRFSLLPIKMLRHAHISCAPVRRILLMKGVPRGPNRLNPARSGLPLIRLPPPSPRRRGEGICRARSLPRAGGECGVRLAPLVPSPRLRGEGAGRRMRGA